MPERKFTGIDAPLVEGRIKYEVRMSMPTEIWKDPPKATDVLDVRVSRVTADVIEKVTKDVGDVILASQNFSHPNKAKVIDTTVEGFKPGGLVEKGETDLINTYTIDGTGIGKAAERSILVTRAADMKKVLLDGDTTPIKSNTQIREFDTGPITIKNVRITCE